jgi:hypothetical protein
VKLSRYGPATRKRAKISKCEMRLRVRNREIKRDGVLSSRWYGGYGPKWAAGEWSRWPGCSWVGRGLAAGTEGGRRVVPGLRRW